MNAEFEAPADSVPEPEPIEAHPRSMPPPQEPEPIPAATEVEPQSAPVQPGATQEPAVAGVQAGLEPTSAETEWMSLPVTLEEALGTPAYAAGGATVLLAALGVTALRRRRRRASAPGASRDSRPDENNILVLETMAAELEDEPEAHPDRPAPARSDFGRNGVEAAAQTDGAGSHSRFDAQVDAQFAELSRYAREIGLDSLDEREADRPADAIEPGLAALADGHDASDLFGDEASRAFVITDLPGEGTNTTTETAGGTSDALERMFRQHGGDAVADSEAREPTRVLGAEASTNSDTEMGPLAAARQDDTVSLRSGTSGGAASRDEAGASALVLRGHVDRSRGSGEGSGGTQQMLHRPPEDPLLGDVTEALPIGEVGEDELQTKTHLAELYMQMGDSDRARGFLDAVLAEGDAEQRETARHMLARLA